MRRRQMFALLKEPQHEGEKETHAEAGKGQVLKCPKCSRPLGRGAHFHIKACKA